MGRHALQRNPPNELQSEQKPRHRHSNQAFSRAAVIGPELRILPPSWMT